MQDIWKHAYCPHSSIFNKDRYQDRMRPCLSMRAVRNRKMWLPQIKQRTTSRQQPKESRWIHQSIDCIQRLMNRKKEIQTTQIKERRHWQPNRISSEHHTDRQHKLSRGEPLTESWQQQQQKRSAKEVRMLHNLPPPPNKKKGALVKVERGKSSSDPYYLHAFNWSKQNGQALQQRASRWAPETIWLNFVWCNW